MGVSREIARNERGIWILEIDIGRPLYFSTKAVVVPRDRGDTIQVNAGLADFSLGTSVGAEVTLGFTIDASLSVRGAPVNWAVLVGEGVDLEERPAILRRWFPGQNYEDARTWLKGTTFNAEYGDPNAFVGRLVISVRRRPTLGKPIPRAQEAADIDTWPVAGGTLPSQMQGATYPLIFGAPGTNAIPLVTGGLAVTPAIMAEFNGGLSILVIARGRVQAQSVIIFDLNNPLIVSESRTVQVKTDLLGQEVSFIDFIGISSITIVEGGKYYAGWQADGGATFGGGAIDQSTGELIRGAVDVISFLLMANGTEVDLGRMAALKTQLNSYLIDTYINTPTVAFDFLREQITPMLPVVERQGEQGLYYDLERWEARPTEAVFTIDADNRQMDRTAPLVKRQQGEIFNEFTIEYAPFAATGRYTRRLTITAQDGFLTDTTPLSTFSGVITPNARIQANLLCSISQSRFGLKVAPPVKGDIIWDDATALKILRDRASRDALPKRATQYTGGPEYEFLADMEGAIILVKDAEVGLVPAVGRIDNVTVGGESSVTVVDITLIDDPTQLTRLT